MASSIDPSLARSYYEIPMLDVNNIHPLIPNSQNYILYKKFVTIHSEDRNIINYPRSSEFEIQLPEDIINVVSAKITNWTFPSNYNTFSILNSNIGMTFKLINPYNPNENGVSSPLQETIFEALFYNKDRNYVIIIEQGFYNPAQLVTELTNKFNEAVTRYILNYFEDNGYTDLAEQFIAKGGYRQFIIVYNSVAQKIWFGNRSSQFELTNESQLIKDALVDNIFCGPKQQLPDFSDWGLPENLGMARCNVTSEQIDGYTPRFYYGDVLPGDRGFWLLPDPDLSGCIVSFYECPFKINIMGPSYFYIDIPDLNCIDETKPFNISAFTLKTNQTNGVCNSAFAKIPVSSTPISQFYGFETNAPYKLFYPPAERIRKLNIKLRYHNNQLVDFGTFNYAFTIEFSSLIPAQPRGFKTVGSQNR